MPALALTILTMLPQITVGATHLINWLHEVREVRQQSHEWTEEEEALFIANVIKRGLESSAYKTDAEISGQ